jgi:anti-sigma factor RsiW
MACLDELTLDLWLADALPSDEAASVAAHVRTCAACASAMRAARAEQADIHAALALDAEERAYLRGLELASTWRSSPAPASLAWGWIVLAGAIAGCVAWLVAASTVGSALDLALQVGLGTVVINAVLNLLFSTGQALFDVVRNPALGLSQPLLAMLALALLFWPRQLIPQRSANS